MLEQEQEREVKKELKRLNRRTFLTAGAAAIAGAGAWEWLRSRSTEDGALWPLRHGLRWNERFARTYFSETRLAREFPPDAADDIRPNGDVGIDDDDFDPTEWKLKVAGLAGGPRELTLADITGLPRVELTAEFKCIEGWSNIVNWTGARLVDFVKKYPPAGMSGSSYVAVETPDSAYYVGLDIPSALHPQTLLAYQMNGKPLEDEHGAPLRLVIPVKYGIKNLKRIGQLNFTRERPKDYWAERGYDWYAGF